MSSDFLERTSSPRIRQMLSAAFAQTRMAMVFTDPAQPDNPIIAVNPAFQALTGYEEQEILGRNCRFLQGEGSDPAVVGEIRRTLSERRVGYFELLNYRKDGTSFWNALHVGPVYDEDGSLIFFFGSQWDMTEKMEALEALKGQMRTGDVKLQEAIDEGSRLRMALDQANDAVIITEYGPIDLPGPRIIYASQAFERMTGYGRDEIIGQTPRIFQGERTDRHVLDEIRSALERGGASNSTTINYRKDGSPYHLEWSIAPVCDANGRPTHWLSVQRDVTKRVEAEERRKFLSEELNHRHKNVFALVNALLSSLPKDGLSAHEFHRHASSRLAALAEAHAAVFEDRSTDNAPMRTVVSRVIGELTDAGRVEAEGDEIDVPGRQSLNIALVLHELTTNALKYGALSRSGGRVTLGWRRVGEALWFDWAESGGPPVRAPSRSGFGTRMLRALALDARQRDDAALLFEPEGLVCRGSVRLR